MAKNLVYSATGVRVTVPDSAAERLTGRGFEEVKKTARKAAAKKAEKAETAEAEA